MGLACCERLLTACDPCVPRPARPARPQKLEPPEDKSICTLFVGGVAPDMSEDDIRDAFYSYGELKAVRAFTGRAARVAAGPAGPAGSALLGKEEGLGRGGPAG